MRPIKTQKRMLSASDRARLNHILDATTRIGEALLGHSWEQFLESWEKQLVIERLLEIIGEAASHLSSELQANNDQIPWPRIVGMRNLVSHEYFRVDPQTIWRTAVDSVPTLRQQIQLILERETK
jgi:uncharacterized protein with HEPN domain